MTDLAPGARETFGLRCTTCKAGYDATVWIVVNRAIAPHLFEAAVEGRLQRSTCPNGHQGGIGAPLLLLQPSEEIAAFYIPMADEKPDLRQEYEALCEMYRRASPAAADLPSLERACIVERTDDGPLRLRYDCHELPGSTRRFLRLVREARASADPCFAWEAILHHPAFDAAPSWFQRGVYSEAAAAWYKRHQKADHASVNRAAELIGKAVMLARPGATAIGLLHNQGVICSAQYAMAGDVAALQLASSALEQALALGPAANRRTYLLKIAGRTRLELFILFNRRDDLRFAIRHLIRCIGSSGPEGPAPETLSSLCFALVLEHKRSARPSFLQLANRLADQAVSRADGDDDALLGAKNSRAIARINLYEWGASAADLDEAVVDLEDALQLAGETPMKARLLTNMADALRWRYFRDGRAADLEQAWRSAQQALTVAAAGSADAAGALNNWATVANEMFSRDRKRRWLDPAIDALQEALSHHGSMGAGAELLQSNLAACLLGRGQATECKDDIRLAIEAAEAVLAGNPERAVRLGTLLNLAAALPLDTSRGQSRYREAVEAVEEALRLAAQPAERRQIEIRLAMALSVLPGDGEDSERLLGLFERGVAEARSGAPTLAFDAAQRWLRFALSRSQWRSAATAAEEALSLAERLFAVQADDTGKAGEVKAFQTLGPLAAIAFARAGEPDRAVLALEAARARLTSDRTLRRSLDIRRLAELGRTDLAARYESALAEAERHDLATRMLANINEKADGPPMVSSALWTSTGNSEVDRSNFELAHAFEAKKARFQAELRSAIDEIRHLPGFNSFLRPPSSQDLREWLFEGPADAWKIDAAVYLVAQPEGAVALIVRKAGVTSRWLPLEMERLMQVLVRNPGGEPGYRLGQLDDVHVAETIEELLALLADGIVRPLVEELESLGTGRNLLFVPTGQLTTLPLHAAAARAGRGDPMIEDYVLAYGLSASLWKCGELQAARAGTISAAIVADPAPLLPPWCPLPAARIEGHAVLRCLGGNGTLLTGRDAALDKVVEAMHGRTIAHFAAHGEYDLEAPWDSGLVLAGGEKLAPLRLAGAFDRVGRENPFPRLVVLSACQSGVTDHYLLPEESAGLPTAFIEAGAAAVIAALWPVDDLPTALLMTRFYQLLLEQSRDSRPQGQLAPAEALRQAQRWMRDLTADELKRMSRNDEPGPTEPLTELFVAQEDCWAGEFPFRDPYYWAGFVCYGR